MPFLCSRSVSERVSLFVAKSHHRERQSGMRGNRGRTWIKKLPCEECIVCVISNTYSVVLPDQSFTHRNRAAYVAEVNRIMS